MLGFSVHVVLQARLSFLDSSVCKESACQAGDPILIPGSGRSAGEGIRYRLQYSWASLVAQLIKNPPAIRETWVRSLDWEDPLERGRATHSSILPGEFHTIVCEVRKNQTQLSDFHFYFSYQEHVLFFICCFFSIVQIFSILLRQQVQELYFLVSYQCISWVPTL